MTDQNSVSELIPRDHFYTLISRGFNKECKRFFVEFRPVFINIEGRWDDRNLIGARKYYIEFETEQEIYITMERIIDYIYEKCKENDIYEYLKIELDHKGIILCKPHTSLMALWGSIVELLYQLIIHEIIIRDHINFLTIENSKYPFDGLY